MKTKKRNLKEIKMLIEFQVREIRLAPCKKQKLRDQILLEIIKRTRTFQPTKKEQFSDEVLIQNTITTTIHKKTNEITLPAKLEGLLVPDFSIYGGESILSLICRWNTSVIFVMLYILFATSLVVLATFVITWDIRRPEKSVLPVYVFFNLYLLLTGFLFFNFLLAFGIVAWKTNALYFSAKTFLRKILIQCICFLEAMVMFISSVFLFSLAGLLLSLEIQQEYRYCGAALVVYFVFFAIPLIYSGTTRKAGSPRDWLFGESPKSICMAIVIFLLFLFIGESALRGLRVSALVLFVVVINLFPAGLLLSMPKNLHFFRKWIIWNQFAMPKSKLRGS